MDRVSTEARSRNMAAVRSVNNKTTELYLVSFFRKERITGWRRGSKIYGRPDFVFPRIRRAIFVDGCFWHGCKGCRTIPKQNRVFWSKKINKNRVRDSEVVKVLKNSKWNVIRIWEHELTAKNRDSLLLKLRGHKLASTSRNDQ